MTFGLGRTWDSLAMYTHAKVVVVCVCVCERETERERERERECFRPRAESSDSANPWIYSALIIPPTCSANHSTAIFYPLSIY